MSKKKNTLKDLDEFLKQQAATLVSPVQLSEKIDAPEPVKQNISPTPAVATTTPDEEVSVSTLLRDLNTLAAKEGSSYRKKFYDLIIQSLENQNQSLPEDKMLINTALYLKSGDNWKDAIRNYWKGVKR
ncbi:MAG TPA: hypothetical protein PLJ60_10000 [Chryseolinea sp.]|nr:hypothetical protein [Chryseolinea sp.]HPH46875.1 hypothetical protein [Chryseolinea sp.]HPM30655.1 hypothetical protein [Chryseolinea sp.]